MCCDVYVFSNLSLYVQLAVRGRLCTQCTEINNLYCLQSYHRTRTIGFSSLTRHTGRFLSKPTKFFSVHCVYISKNADMICVDLNNDLCCTSLEVVEVWLNLLTIFNIIISIQHNAYVHT
jgi:hypothetical protein